MIWTVSAIGMLLSLDTSIDGDVYTTEIRSRYGRTSFVSVAYALNTVRHQQMSNAATSEMMQWTSTVHGYIYVDISVALTLLLSHFNIETR